MSLMPTERNECERLEEENRVLREANAALIAARSSEGFLRIPHIANDRDFSEAIIACDKLLTTKGNDYTQGAEGDYGRLKNFYTSADAFKSLTPYTCLGVLFKKHIDAIYTFLDKGRVESEPIEGRIHDAINYLLLMIKMVAYEKRKANGHGVPVAVVDNQGLVK